MFEIPTDIKDLIIILTGETVILIFLIINLWINKLETYKKEKTKLSPPIKLDKSNTKIERLKEFEEIDKYLYDKLSKIYNIYIFKSILLTLRKFGSISEDNRKELKTGFIKLVEFNCTEEEKDIFKTRYTFDQFKYILVEYFNIKTTKLELMIVQKLDINDTEFADYKLISSIFNDIDKKEIMDILNTINENNK